MGQIGLGINLEYVRHADRPFEYGVKKAAALGYEYVEPCVATGRDLLAESGYYHMLSMEDDPLAVREMCDSVNLRISGVSAHSPLMKPEVSVNYLRQAIRFASDLGAPVVNTDEGPKPKWMDDRQAFEIMKYTLSTVLPTAERYKVTLALEPHQLYTTRLDTFLKLLDLVRSPALKVNFDTGNVFLAGQDPIEFLDAVADRVVHVHAKDIHVEQSKKERGRVTGTPTGCACGDGVIDWKKVIDVLDRHQFSGVFSVECGTEEQADRSAKYLGALIKARESAQTQAAPKPAPKPHRAGKKAKKRRR